MNKQKLFWCILICVAVTVWLLIRSSADVTFPSVASYSVDKRDTVQESLKPTVSPSRQVALSCTTDMATEFHIHPTLQIFVDGVEVPVPHNIGIKPTCMNALHTHSDTPVIHVESPEKHDFTLGDFFAVWGESFDRNTLFEYTDIPAGNLIVSVNGVPVATYEDTVLYDKDVIIITLTTK